MNESSRSRGRLWSERGPKSRKPEAFTGTPWRGIILDNGVGQFIAEYWIDIVQSIGIVGGLFATAYTIRQDGMARQVGNLLTITKHHREIWAFVIENPELSRILSSDMNLSREPVTTAERLFVRFLVLHLASSFEAQRRQLFPKDDKLGKDIHDFFSLPIPNAIWKELRPYQEREFVDFVEDELNPNKAESDSRTSGSCE